MRNMSVGDDLVLVGILFLVDNMFLSNAAFLVVSLGVEFIVEMTCRPARLELI